MVNHFGLDLTYLLKVYLPVMDDPDKDSGCPVLIYFRRYIN